MLLYAAPFCAECDRARGLLERRGIAFEEIDLSADPERCCELEALTGGGSVPQLVIDGRPIGGFAELAALDRVGGFSIGDEPRPEHSGEGQVVTRPRASFETVTMKQASLFKR